ncbi:MAG: hypothetical protein MJZ03_06635 [archaeon]|nr:hypothetical protein [archaeon]
MVDHCRKLLVSYLLLIIFSPAGNYYGQYTRCVKNLRPEGEEPTPEPTPEPEEPSEEPQGDEYPEGEVGEFNKGEIAATNDKRALSWNTPKIAYNATLAKAAQEWADKVCAKNGEGEPWFTGFEHEEGVKGESMAGIWEWTPGKATELFCKIFY